MSEINKLTKRMEKLETRDPSSGEEDDEPYYVSIVKCEGGHYYVEYNADKYGILYIAPGRDIDMLKFHKPVSLVYYSTDEDENEFDMMVALMYKVNVIGGLDVKVRCDAVPGDKLGKYQSKVNKLIDKIRKIPEVHKHIDEQFILRERALPKTKADVDKMELDHAFTISFEDE